MVGKNTLKAVIENYETYRRDGVIPASYEVVFGHAWCPEKKQYKSIGGDIRIPLSTIGRAKQHGL
jgi:malonyl-CoA O-methyltransferase